MNYDEPWFLRWEEMSGSKEFLRLIRQNNPVDFGWERQLNPRGQCPILNPSRLEEAIYGAILELDRCQ